MTKFSSIAIEQKNDGQRALMLRSELYDQTGAFIKHDTEEYLSSIYLSIVTATPTRDEYVHDRLRVKDKKL